MTVEQLAPAVKKMGMVGIDLLTPDQWLPLKQHDLVCTMTCGPYTIEVGLNRKDNHGPILNAIRRNIELTSDAGFANVICFAGNRHVKKDGRLTDRINDEEGMKTCADAIK